MATHPAADPNGVVLPEVRHPYLAWNAAVAGVGLAIIGLLLVPGIGPPPEAGLRAERQSLIEFRAAERADWAAGVARPEWKALIEFRAAERADWAAGVPLPEWKALIEFRAAEREGR